MQHNGAVAPTTATGMVEAQGAPAKEFSPVVVRALGRLVGAVAAPPALIIALAYYFSVKRQEALALHFGIDVSVLDYSTRDYLLRGGDTLFLLLLAGALLGLVTIRGHFRLAHLLERSSSERLVERMTSMASAAGWSLLIIGLAGIFRPLPLGRLEPLEPLSFGVGVGLLGYGELLRRNAASRTGLKSVGSVHPAWADYVALAFMALVVALSVFWSTKDLAVALGRGQAQTLETHLGERPGVVVYSGSELALSGPGLHQDVFAETSVAQRYRYAGLRLLVRTGNGYFLIPEDWSSGHGTVFLLRESPDLRFEFSPGGRP